jgi:hypothetical protein
MTEWPIVDPPKFPMPPVKPPAVHAIVSSRRLEEYWRKEAEFQAAKARAMSDLVDFERNRSRWAWWMWGVLVGALVGWCLAVWRLN